MRRIFCVLSVLIFSSSASASFCESSLESKAFADLVSRDRLQRFIEFLTGEKPILGHHRLYDRNSDRAREVVRQALVFHFRGMGLAPVIDAFTEGANVIVEIPGTETPHEVVELAAHFDSISVGADDNAAGVALLVHLAELFNTHPPKKSVRFVFHDLEERSGEGARHHVRALGPDPRKLLGSIIIDAIGYYPENFDRQILSIDTGGKDFNRPLAQLLAPIAPLELSFETNNEAASHADHGLYWLSDRPALLISRPFNARFQHPHNHGRLDTVNHLNWAYYMSASQVVADLAYRAAMGSKGATWIEWPPSLVDQVKEKVEPPPARPSRSEYEPIDRHEGYLEGLRAALEEYESFREPRFTKKKPSPIAPAPSSSSLDTPPFASSELAYDFKTADPYIKALIKAHESEFPGAFSHKNIIFYTQLERLSYIQQHLIKELGGNERFLTLWQDREPQIHEAKIRVGQAADKKETRSLNESSWDYFRQNLVDFVESPISEYDSPESMLRKLARAVDQVHKDKNRFLFPASDKDYMRALTAYIIAAGILDRPGRSLRASELLDELEDLETGALDYLEDPIFYEPLLKRLRNDSEAAPMLARARAWIDEHIYTGVEDASLIPGAVLTLREVHPNLAIFRGYVGNDCSTSFSPGFSLTPADRYYYIYDEQNRALGYVGVSLVTMGSDEQKAVLVHTVQGPHISYAQTEMVLRAFAKLATPHFGAVAAVLSSNQSIDANVNFQPIRSAMLDTVRGEPVHRLRFWDHEFRKVIAKFDSTMNYDDPIRNSEGRILRFVNPDAVSVEWNGRPFSAEFSEPDAEILSRLRPKLRHGSDD